MALPEWGRSQVATKGLTLGNLTRLQNWRGPSRRCPNGNAVTDFQLGKTVLSRGASHGLTTVASAKTAHFSGPKTGSVGFQLPPTAVCGHHYRGWNRFARWT